MSIALQLTIRLLAAGLVGAIIGYERELRAKGAGIRTHVLVALGSCLFMIISIFGFGGVERFDAARVAAGVVGGLGFLGGGIIMKTQNHVTGLTTAAGLWVTGAIGLGFGCGLYEVSILSSILVLISLEALYFYTIHLGQRDVSVVLSAKDQSQLSAAITQLGRKVKEFSLAKQGDTYKANVLLHVPRKEYGPQLLEKLSSFPGTELESME